MMIVAIGVVLVVFLVIVACRCYWISTKVDKRTGRCKVLAVLGSGEPGPYIVRKF